MFPCYKYTRKLAGKKFFFPVTIGSTGVAYSSNNKANLAAECFEYHFIPHDNLGNGHTKDFF